MNQHRSRLQPHTYLYLGIAIAGLLVTTVLFQAGTLTASAGPVQFDAYYAALYGFGFLLVFSLFQRYTQTDD